MAHLEVEDDDWTELETKNRHLVLMVDDERYLISTSYVAEIIRLPEVTKIPDMPPYVVGVINQRGNVVLIMDLRVRLGRPAVEVGRRSVLVIVEKDQSRVGVIADAVTDVVSVASDEIESVNESTNGRENHIVNGMVRREGHVDVVLNVERLFVKIHETNDSADSLHEATS